MADAKLEFDIVGHAESAVAAFGETAAAADGAAQSVDRMAKKHKQSLADMAAAERAAQPFFQRLISGGMMSLAGAGGGAGGAEGAAGEGASFFETLGPQFGYLAAGALAAAPAIAAVVVEVTALASGFVAAAAGAGAFAALAIPSFKILQTNYSQLVANQQDFANASQLIATSIQSSAADATQYQKSIADPATRGAVELLNNQNTVWQNLTSSQQNAVIALDNNKKAMANLLPAQKQALGVLMQENDAWGNLTPSQQLAVGSLDRIRTAYDKMSLAFQPAAFKIFGDALKIVADLMPKILPLANAFAGAIGSVLQQADKMVGSKSFDEFFKKLLAIVGPATKAIGDGILQLLPTIGRFFTLMSSHDVVHAINILFDVINDFFRVMILWIQGAMRNWDSLSRDIEHWYNDTKKWLERAQHDLANWAQNVDNFVKGVTVLWHRAVTDVQNWRNDVARFVGEVVKFFIDLPGQIISALAHLGDQLFQVGVNAIMGLWHGAESVFGGLLSTAQSWGHDIANAIGSVFGIHFSEPSEATQMVKAGQKITAGLAQGIASGRSLVNTALGSLLGMGVSFPGQAGAAAGGAGTITLYLEGGEGPITNAIMEAIRAEAQGRGGGALNSVQIAFGSHH